MSISELLIEFREIAGNPKRQLDHYKAEGKQAIGILPYYAPEELVYAAGMVPFGIWGTNDKTISLAKEYCATFYCTIAQLSLEMLLDGTMDKLDGVITPTLCDTLRPMSQNIRVVLKGKMPVIFLAHPQNRFGSSGRSFTMHQYSLVKEQLEQISGQKITDYALTHAIAVYNESREERRRFVKLAASHADLISTADRSAVLKSAWFMLKDAYTKKLKTLNTFLESVPVHKWDGATILTSGIICDNPDLLKILDENKIAIVADDVAQESRAFRTDVPDDPNPMMALARQFEATDYDVLLYDPESSKNRRADHVVRMIKRSGADGLILFMQQFCDPEEMEYPYLKKALDAADIPHIRLGLDQQMRDFGQARTAIQAFADMLTLR